MSIEVQTVSTSWKKVGSLFRKPKKEPFKYNSVMQLAHGQLDPVLDWCNEHCVGEWGWMDHTDFEKSLSNHWIFLFDNDDDYTYFLLRWK